MKSHILGKLLSVAALLVLIPANNVQACVLDYTSSLHAPSVCGSSPVSAYNFAGPSGGSAWTGTGYGNLGSITSDYTYVVSSGFWGWHPASMGVFYLGDLIITGGPASEVNVSVNVAYGGTATAPIPATQGLSWAVKLFDTADGDLIGAVTTGNSYTPNSGTQTATSSLLVDVPVGTTFSLEMSAQWYHAQGARFEGTTTGDMFIQFLSSEVFNLPDGYTLNSGSGGIEDNIWSSAVPVPAAVWLFMGGIGLLGWFGRRETGA